VPGRLGEAQDTGDLADRAGREARGRHHLADRVLLEAAGVIESGVASDAVLDAQVAALTHDGLMPTQRVQRIISAPLPTGVRRRRMQLTHQARRRITGWLDRPLSGLDRLPGLRGRVCCPLCGWTGARFRPTVSGGRIRAGMLCPQCRGGRRHRLFWLAWQAEQTSTAGRCLHMAPEDWLAPRLAAAARTVIAIDLEPDGVDVAADAERLPFRDHHFDTVICNDVLEHVADDQQALREVARVLRPAGTAYLHTPLVAEHTVEYGFANLLDHGHRRAYGPDLVLRVRNAGLAVTLFRTSDLVPADRRRFGLEVPDAILIGRRPGAGQSPAGGA
jgi:SAM-dependent methyltransferase